MPENPNRLIDTKETVESSKENQEYIKKYIPDLPEKMYKDVEVIFEKNSFAGLRLKGEAERFVKNKNARD